MAISRPATVIALGHWQGQAVWRTTGLGLLAFATLMLLLSLPGQQRAGSQP